MRKAAERSAPDDTTAPLTGGAPRPSIDGSVALSALTGLGTVAALGALALGVLSVVLLYGGFALSWVQLTAKSPVLVAQAGPGIYSLQFNQTGFVLGVAGGGNLNCLPISGSGGNLYNCTDSPNPTFNSTAAAYGNFTSLAYAPSAASNWPGTPPAKVQTALDAIAGYALEVQTPVPRPLLSKLEDWVSVKDYGAVGDGVTDSASAFNAALSAPGASIVIVPAGTYLLNSANIMVREGVTLATIRAVAGLSTSGVFDASPILLLNPAYSIVCSQSSGLRGFTILSTLWSPQTTFAGSMAQLAVNYTGTAIVSAQGSSQYATLSDLEIIGFNNGITWGDISSCHFERLLIGCINGISGGPAGEIAYLADILVKRFTTAGLSNGTQSFNISSVASNGAGGTRILLLSPHQLTTNNWAVISGQSGAGLNYHRYAVTVVSPTTVDISVPYNASTMTNDGWLSASVSYMGGTAFAFTAAYAKMSKCFTFGSAEGFVFTNCYGSIVGCGTDNLGSQMQNFESVGMTVLGSYGFLNIDHFDSSSDGVGMLLSSTSGSSSTLVTGYGSFGRAAPFVSLSMTSGSATFSACNFGFATAILQIGSPALVDSVQSAVFVGCAMHSLITPINLTPTGLRAIVQRGNAQLLFAHSNFDIYADNLGSPSTPPTSGGAYFYSSGGAAAWQNPSGTFLYGLVGSNNLFGGNAVPPASGLNNFGWGYGALTSLTNGNNNFAAGYNAGHALQTGNQNSFAGSASGASCTASQNTGFGASSLLNVGAGVANSAFGNLAGQSVTSGSNNVFIGQGSDVASGSLSNCIVLGTGAVCQASASLTIGSNVTGHGITTQTTVGSAGAASALPATPSSYLQWYINGKLYVTPLYAAV